MRQPLSLILAVVLFQAVTTSAQNQALKFEVTSVKPNMTGRGGLEDMPSTGRVNFSGVTFRMLMNAAYRVQNFQIIGGPAWLAVDRFDVQASPPADFHPQAVKPCFVADCPASPVQIMMQGLLADRFQLKVHRETRELPVYDLMIAKNGSKLKEVSEPLQAGPDAGPPPLAPPPPPGTPPPTTAAGLPSPAPGVTMGFPFAFVASAVKLRALGIFLEELLGRSVIDKTGLQGFYDLKFVFSREGITGNGFAPSPGAAGGGAGLNASDPRPSIFTALQEELGLRLESSRGPVEVLVIDSVAKPTAN